MTGGTYLAVSGYEYANGFGYHNRVNANLNSTFALEWDLGRLVTKGLVLRGMISYDAVSQTSTEGVKRSKNYALQVGSDGESFNYINNFTDDINMIVYKGARYVVQDQHAGDSLLQPHVRPPYRGRDVRGPARPLGVGRR